MNIDTWENGCKVRAFEWIDNETIYMNVQYFKGGSSIHNPAWEKTVYITNNDNGKNMVKNFLNSLVEYVCRLDIPAGAKAVLTF